MAAPMSKKLPKTSGILLRRNNVTGAGQSRFLLALGFRALGGPNGGPNRSHFSASESPSGRPLILGQRSHPTDCPFQGRKSSPKFREFCCGTTSRARGQSRFLLALVFRAYGGPNRPYFSATETASGRPPLLGQKSPPLYGPRVRKSVAPNTKRLKLAMGHDVSRQIQSRMI